MNYYLGFLKRQFLWALAGLVVFISYSWFWGGPFIATLLEVTGLSEAPHASLLGPGQWIGLALGTLLVMSPAIAGFAFHMVARIGWPGRPVPEPRRRKSYTGLGTILAVAVVAFLLVGLIGDYWPPSGWRTGLAKFASAADFGIDNAEWVGDMYFGLFIATIGLYAVYSIASVRLPDEVELAENPSGSDPTQVAAGGGDAETGAIVESAGAPPAPTTGIWWPFAAGTVVVVISWVAALWPHLP